MPLWLVMIVRNEIRSIARTLESVQEHVDGALILDTGSTDGTLEHLHWQVGIAKPFDVRQGPFVDFATTRNRALELAEERAGPGAWLLMLSGDEHLEGGAVLRSFCRDAGASPGAYELEIHFGNVSTPSPRLTQVGAGWRYKFPVHEFLAHPEGRSAGPPLPGVRVVHAHDGARDMARMNRQYREFDLPTLWRARALDPQEPRTVFYLARTLEAVGERWAAIRVYNDRIAMDAGYQDERAYSALSAARLMAPDPDYTRAAVVAKFLEAYGLNPRRAEALVELARLHRTAAPPNYPLAHLFASMAARIPQPTRGLFTETNAYWQAQDELAVAASFMTDYQAEGFAAARRAVEARPDDPRLVANLGLYAARSG